MALGLWNSCRLRTCHQMGPSVRCTGPCRLCPCLTFDGQESKVKRTVEVTATIRRREPRRQIKDKKYRLRLFGIDWSILQQQVHRASVEPVDRNPSCRTSASRDPSFFFFFCFLLRGHYGYTPEVVEFSPSVGEIAKCWTKLGRSDIESALAIIVRCTVMEMEDTRNDLPLTGPRAGGIPGHHSKKGPGLVSGLHSVHDAGQ